MQSDKSFRIDYNPKLGRHLVAVRDIELGEIVLDDFPLVLGPSTFIDTTSKDSSAPESVCPTCYVKLSSSSNNPEDDSSREVGKSESGESGNNNSNSSRLSPDSSLDEENYGAKTFPCIKCGLTLCSKVCSETSIHAQNECIVFQNIPALHEALEGVRDLHQFITTIRCLYYRKRDPIKWAQVKELQARVDELEKMGVYEGVDKGFSLLSWQSFDSEDDDPPRSQEAIEEDIVQTAKHCLGVLRTNAFSRFSSKISIECLYFLSSFMAHNCLMNTDRYFDMDGVRLVTRAATRISKGQPITTTYLSHLNNNIERHREMRSVWNFSCDCERCLDPTECKTSLSTIVCPSCKSLTLNPHLIPNSENHEWICANAICGNVLRDTEDVVAHLENTVWLVENDQPDIRDLQATEKWLTLYDNGKYLHSNNSIFLQVKLYLCQEYGSSSGGMSILSLSNEALIRKMALCDEVIQVLDKILRGAFLLKGVVLFEFWLALMEIHARNDQDLLGNFAVDDETIESVATRAKAVLRFGSHKSAEQLMFNILQEDNDNN